MISSVEGIEADRLLLHRADIFGQLANVVRGCTAASTRSVILMALMWRRRRLTEAGISSFHVYIRSVTTTSARVSTAQQLIDLLVRLRDVTDKERDKATERGGEWKGRECGNGTMNACGRRSSIRNVSMAF